MTACTACTKPITTEWELATTLCEACANEFGVMPMPPARRPARACERCNGMQFIRAIPRELTAFGNDHVNEVASPMQVTYQLQVRSGLFGGKRAVRLDSRKAFGFVEQYICRKCGFIEWYCSNPERVPIGPAYMTEAIDYDTAAEPYR
ncbi:MAG TPA: hypothetical protein VIU61_03050 [Kofleriaceae bacterium]